MTQRKIYLGTLTADGSVTRQLPLRGIHLATAELVFTGAGSTSIQLSGSNDNTNFTNIGSAITATDRDVPILTNNLSWRYIRATASTTSGVISVDINIYTQ